MKPHILIVDDDPLLLDAMRRQLDALANRFLLTFLDSADLAWQRVQEEPISGVVCDVRMPGVTGLEFLERMSSTDRTRSIPVVMLTGFSDFRLKSESLRLGAIDVIAKPIDFEEFVARLDLMVQMKGLRDELAFLRRGAFAEDAVSERVVGPKEYVNAAPYLACLYRVARQAEHGTEDHVVRVGWYSREMAIRLGLDRTQQNRLLWTAPLHDIGKVCIPSHILEKRGRLTPGEWDVMRQHCALGEAILRGHATDFLAIHESSDPADLLHLGPDPLLATAATIALTHHEKWNGSGYPLGLAGPRIPLEARIVCVADVFDSMISERPYHGAASLPMARDWIRHLRGQFFDPAVVDAFDKSYEDLRMIRDLMARESSSEPYALQRELQRVLTADQPSAGLEMSEPWG